MGVGLNGFWPRGLTGVGSRLLGFPRFRSGALGRMREFATYTLKNVFTNSRSPRCGPDIIFIAYLLNFIGFYKEKLTKISKLYLFFIFSYISDILIVGLRGGPYRPPSWAVRSTRSVIFDMLLLRCVDQKEYVAASGTDFLCAFFALRTPSKK